MHYVSLSEAKELLLDEQLVIIPTETVYGLAGLATSQTAVERIFTYKKRPSDNPLICHFYDKNHIVEYVGNIPKQIEILMDALCPGPLSFILSPSDTRLSPAIRGQPKVACRIPDNQDTLDLIKIVHHPLAAPSANPSGKPSSTTAEMAFEYFKDVPGGVLQSIQSDIGLESTIVEFRDEKLYIMREGAVGLAEIKQILPDTQVVIDHHPQNTVPGSKYRHYAPNTPIIPISTLEQIYKDGDHNLVVITTKEEVPTPPLETTIVYVSQTNSTSEISHNLYKTLINIDSLNCPRAYWYLPQRENQSSLGQALENRLRKVFALHTHK